MTDDLLGRTIGGYRVQARVGAGAMGVVYLAVHPGLGRRVAVKVLHPGAGVRDATRRRFVDEARALAATRSPHVVEILDLAQLEDGRDYLVTEFLEGESVAALRARAGVLSPAHAVAIAARALDGIAAAHAVGVVHRDVKPANLVVARAPDGAPVLKVVDFGLAKLRALGGGATQAGVVGTPEYMAPEQMSERTEDADARADLYAMGVVLYELLAGRRPFEAPTWPQLFLLHKTATPPPIGRPDVPPALEAAVMRALEKDPARRWATAAEMRRAIVDAVGGALPPLPAVRAARGGGGAIWAILAIAASLVVVVAALAIVGGVAWGRRATRAQAATEPVVSDRSTASAAASTPAPKEESCTLSLTDDAGTAHEWGGPRATMPAVGRAQLFASMQRGALLVRCTTDIGAAHMVMVAVPIPENDLTPGRHSIAAGGGTTTLVTFMSLPPAGFRTGAFMLPFATGDAAVPAGELDLSEVDVRVGGVVAGTYEATLPPSDPSSDAKPTRARVRFRIGM